MKKRKLLISILSGLCVCLASTTLFTACGEKHTHTYTAQTTAATCTEKGVITYSCTCGDSYTEEIPATGVHTWDDGKVTTEPTCTEKGVKTFTCTVCETTTYTEDVEALKHDEKTHQAQEYTCTEIGWKEYVTCEREGCDYSTYEEIPAQHNIQNGCCVGCNVPESTAGLIYIENPDGTYTVTGIGTCKETEIVVGIYNNKSVTAIGAGAFYYCYNLTSVVIGDSVTFIGASAFSCCTSLTSITVNENNTVYKSMDGNLYSKDGGNLIQYAIGKTATSFTIPDSVTSIGHYAFEDCDSLTSVVIGDSVASIGFCVFAYCRSLTSITVKEKNITYKSMDGNVYSKDGGNLIQYAIGKTATSFTIPDGVTSIGDNAFYNCGSLTEIVIPDSVTTIGDTAFSNCIRLTSVEIGDSVTSIGDDVFRYCRSLTSITVDENNTVYKSMDGNVYSKDGGILIQYALGKTATSFTLPDSVTSIGDKAFFTCIKLTSVVIGDSVISIGWGAFYDCDRLTSVVIGDSVTSIGYVAFGNCSSLISIEIPDSVTSIGSRAFDDCSSLTSVVIGDGVTTIGNGAFSGCDSLTSVYYKGTADEWLNISIDDNYNLTWYYYSENEPALNADGTAYDGNYWKYGENGEIYIWTKETV